MKRNREAEKGLALLLSAALLFSVPAVTPAYAADGEALAGESLIREGESVSEGDWLPAGEESVSQGDRLPWQEQESDWGNPPRRE